VVVAAAAAAVVETEVLDETQLGATRQPEAIQTAPHDDAPTAATRMPTASAPNQQWHSQTEHAGSAARRAIQVRSALKKGR